MFIISGNRDDTHLTQTVHDIAETWVFTNLKFDLRKGAILHWFVLKHASID